MNEPQAHVWLIELGDNEESSPIGTATSLDEAVESIKDTYPPPYIIRARETDNYWTLICQESTE